MKKILLYLICCFSFLICCFSFQIVLPNESDDNWSDTVKWVNETLLNYDTLYADRIDSALTLIKNSPKEEYRAALSTFGRKVLFYDKSNSRIIRLCLRALMAYNDWRSYYFINSFCSHSRYIKYVAKCFCDVYDENNNKFFAPIRRKLATPEFINKYQILDESNINQFFDDWNKYSLTEMEKDKDNPLNIKIQEFYRWKENEDKTYYVENCKERDSLKALGKRKYKDEISYLQNNIDNYLRHKKVCVMPHYIDVYFSQDTFSNYKDSVCLIPPHQPFLAPGKRDSHTVVVPFLSENVLNLEKNPMFFLSDNQVESFMANHVFNSDDMRDKMIELIGIDIYQFFDYMNIFSALFYSDGVVFQIAYGPIGGELGYESGGGFAVFIPNDKNKEIEDFCYWIP